VSWRFTKKDFMTTILLDGTRLPTGNKSYYFFLEDRVTGERVSRFLTKSKCKEEKQRIDKKDKYKIVGDWVLISG